MKLPGIRIFMGSLALHAQRSSLYMIDPVNLPLHYNGLSRPALPQKFKQNKGKVRDKTERSNKEGYTCFYLTI